MALMRTRRCGTAAARSGARAAAASRRGLTRRRAMAALAAAGAALAARLSPRRRRRRRRSPRIRLAELYVRLSLSLARHQPSLVDTWLGAAGVGRRHARAGRGDPGADRRGPARHGAACRPRPTTPTACAGATSPGSCGPWRWPPGGSPAPAPRSPTKPPRRWACGRRRATPRRWTACARSCRSGCPGAARCAERHAAFRRAQAVPAARVEAVFAAAVAWCREAATRRAARCPPASGSRCAPPTSAAGRRSRGPHDAAHLRRVGVAQRRRRRRATAAAGRARGHAGPPRPARAGDGGAGRATGLDGAGADAGLRAASAAGRGRRRSRRRAAAAARRARARVRRTAVAGRRAVAGASRRCWCASSGWWPRSTSKSPTSPRTTSIPPLGTEAATARLRDEALVLDPPGMLAFIEKQRSRVLAYPLGRRLVGEAVAAAAGGGALGAFRADHDAARCDAAGAGAGRGESGIMPRPCPPPARSCSRPPSSP